MKILSAALLLGTMSCATTATTKSDRTVGEFIDDAAITTSVNGVIVGDDDARFFKIDVTSLTGEVVLQGYVNSRETESRLVAKVRNLKGVKSVKSLLRIEEP